MTNTKANLKRDWFILSSLVGKDFKLKYRRSALGILWSVLNPLFMMIILSVVFSYFFRFQIEHFPVYLILGQTLFTFMSDGTTAAMSSILTSAPLIKKIRINKIIFPLEKVTFALVNFGVSLIAVFAVMIYFRIALTLNMLLIPVLVCMLFVFTLGVGLVLASLAVFFRDVVHLWGVLITAWTYLTPLFYPVEILPAWAIPVMNCNPMYYYVTFFREIMLYGVTPSIGEFAICAAFAVVFLVIGLATFRFAQKKFILYV